MDPYTADLKPFFPQTNLQIKAQLECEDRTWHLTYTITGNASTLKLRPSSLLPQRKENLWQGSCCEIFIQDTKSKQYIEWNFCFSSDWDASEFLDYRKKDTKPFTVKSPSIIKDISPDKIILKTSFAAPPANYSQLRAGISVILEDTHGKLNYWALNHPKPEQKPDFHDERSFCISIADPSLEGKPSKDHCL